MMLDRVAAVRRDLLTEAGEQGVAGFPGGQVGADVVGLGAVVHEHVDHWPTEPRRECFGQGDDVALVGDVRPLTHRSRPGTLAVRRCRSEAVENEVRTPDRGLLPGARRQGRRPSSPGHPAAQRPKQPADGGRRADARMTVAPLVSASRQPGPSGDMPYQ